MEMSRRREKHKKKRVSKPSSLLPHLLLPARPPLPHHLYLPHLHRQQTRVATVGPVGSALIKLASTSLDDDLNTRSGIAAQQEVASIMESIYLSLDRNQAGLKFRRAVQAQGFTHWQVAAERRVICFLPFQIKDLVVRQKDFGRVYLQLSEADEEKDLPTKLDVVSEDFLKYRYVSCKKVYSILIRILRKGLLAKQITEDRLNFSSTLRLLELTLLDAKDWVAEIVPCLIVRGKKSFFISKEFIAPAIGDTPSEIAMKLPNLTSRDTSREDGRLSAGTTVSSEINTLLPIQAHYLSDKETSSQISSDYSAGCSLVSNYDISWYSCNPRTENQLIERIYRTDSGVRMSAMRIVHRLCKADWRLNDVTVYHIQTAMLHDTDHQLDHTPRWQRELLEQCTRAILAQLGQFAQARRLPHFLLQGINLWAGFPTRRFALMSSAIERLMTSDVALLSLVNRAGGFTLPIETQIYSDFLNLRGNKKEKAARDFQQTVKKPFQKKSEQDRINPNVARSAYNADSNTVTTVRTGSGERNSSVVLHSVNFRGVDVLPRSRGTPSKGTLVNSDGFGSPVFDNIKNQQSSKAASRKSLPREDERLSPTVAQPSHVQVDVPRQ